MDCKRAFGRSTGGREGGREPQGASVRGGRQEVGTTTTTTTTAAAAEAGAEADSLAHSINQ